jgi:Bacteriophage HK97-gp10, putative tail-component
MAGEREVRRKLEQLADAYPAAAGAALYQEGMQLWNGAVKRAPVEFGVLRNSAYVSPPVKAGGGNITVEVGFGTSYAVAQHESLHYRHPRGGEAKYLENAMTIQAVGMLGRLVDRIEENVRKGVSAPALGAPSRPRVSSKRRRAKSRKGKRR